MSTGKFVRVCDGFRQENVDCSTWDRSSSTADLSVLMPSTSIGDGRDSTGAAFLVSATMGAEIAASDIRL